MQHASVTDTALVSTRVCVSDARTSPWANSARAASPVSMVIQQTGAAVNVSLNTSPCQNTVDCCWSFNRNSTVCFVVHLQRVSATATPACVTLTVASASVPPRASKETAAMCKCAHTHTLTHSFCLSLWRLSSLCH